MKIDIYSGFLGAGKTTLIKKMIAEAYCGEKLVLIENEFGEIGIDGGFLQDAGVNITEMNSGCICCSLVGDFGKALEQVIADYNPDRIIIEPSGVGKLSDVIAAVEKVTDEKGARVAVADAGKVKSYMKNFGEFYNNQIENAGTIILSRTDSISDSKLEAAVKLLREHNEHAVLITTPWDQLTGAQLKEAMEGAHTVENDIQELLHEHHHDHEEGHCCCHGHGHAHHDHDHEDGHCCHGHGHHHDHEEGHCCHHDHEHHHDHEDGHSCCHGHDHEHHHHHHEDGHCCHEHGHEHYHHADEVFSSWGTETTKKFTMEQIHEALAALDTGRYGTVLRAKGIVAGENGDWIHFDHVPEEADVRIGCAGVIGKLCVIGSQLDNDAIAALFGL